MKTEILIFAVLSAVSCADRLYIEANGTASGGVDVNISTQRNTLRLGGSLVPLIVCNEPDAKLCMESDYFTLLIPGDGSRMWKHGGFAFDWLQTVERSPCEKLSLSHVQSDQAGRLFDFYWSENEGLVAWRVSYEATGRRLEKLFVLDSLKQQCEWGAKERT